MIGDVCLNRTSEKSPSGKWLSPV